MRGRSLITVETDWRTLIRLARDGDEAMLATIFQHLDGRLKSALDKYYRANGAAFNRGVDFEEAVHVAKIKIWQKLGGANLARSQKHLCGFLFRVGMNAAKDLKPKSARRRPAALTDCMDDDEAENLSHGSPACADHARLAPFMDPALEWRSPVLWEYLQVLREGVKESAVFALIAKRRGLTRAQAQWRFESAACRYRGDCDCPPFRCNKKRPVKVCAKGARRALEVQVIVGKT